MKINRTPLKAIKEKCLDCCCGQAAEVKLCDIVSCPLHPFRFGKNPFAKRELTEEQREAMRQRLELAISKSVDKES